MKTCENCEVA
jgi:hypothetical protein